MFQLIVIGVTVLANISLALIVYQNNHKSATNTLLSLLCVVISSWTIFNYLALSADLESTRLFYVRLVMLVTSPFGPLIYLLAATFPKKRIPKLSFLTSFLLVILTAASAILSMSPFVFRGLENLPNGNFKLYPGFGIIIFGANLLTFMTLGFIELIDKFKKSKGLQRKQTGYFLFGMITAFTLSVLTNFVAVVIFQTIELTYLGPPFTLIMLAAISYAIIKHRFLDIRLIVARSIAYLLLVLTLALFYVGGLLGLQQFLFTERVSRQYTISSAVLTLIMIFLFQPLRKLFEKLTENIFYRRDYDPQEFLHNLSNIMSHNLVLQSLISKVIAEIRENLKPIGAALVLVDVNQVNQFQGYGFDDFDRREKGEKYDRALLVFKRALRKKEEQILVFEELEENRVKNMMREFDLDIVLPLRIKDEYIGGLLLKKKSSGEIYSAEDIRLLKIIAPQLAVAVKNALSFKEIKNFNITLKKKIENATAEIRQANERLKEVDALKDEFVSIASHELRTPMTAIKGYLWMVLNKSDQELSDKMRQQLEVAYHSVERLIHLVKDMLTISRIEANKIELNREKIDWNQVLEQVIAEIKPLAKEKEIKLRLEHPEKELLIIGDKNRLAEVLQNIIGNAIKFTSKQGRVEVRVEVQEAEIMTAVTDNGAGISQENIDKLFTKFTKLDRSYKKTKNSGTGLGLYISKQIVTLHNGRIEVESELDQGTTFRIFLPKNQA